MNGIVRFGYGILALIVVFIQCIPAILSIMFIYGVVQFWKALF